LATEKGKRWYDMLKTGDEKSALAAAMEIVHSLSEKQAPIKSDKAVRDARPQYTAPGDRRSLNRAWPIQRTHRLRVDRDWRVQPAPQRDLSRRCEHREPHRAVLA